MSDQPEVVPVRTGVSPSARPTEWILALTGLVSAVLLYVNDRNVAALTAAIAAALPALVTAVVTWWERRHPEAVAVVPAKVNE